MEVKVSIVVPVYGVEQYIEKCAESLFAQTLPEIEFVFVDDCSPDRSVEVLESVLERYPERRPHTIIHRLPQNAGVINARRVGIGLCGSSAGPSWNGYVMFMDSDDYLEPTAVERMYTAAVKENADISICRRRMIADGAVLSGYQSYDFIEAIEPGAYKVIDSSSGGKESNKSKYLGYVVSMTTGRATPEITNKLFRRELIDKIEYQPVYHVGEDWMMYVQLVYHSERIVSINEILFNYLIHDGSLMHGLTFEQCKDRLGYDKTQIGLVERFLEEKGLSKRYKNEIRARKYLAKAWFVAFMDKAEARRLWRDTYREINWSILFNPCLSPYAKKQAILRFLGVEDRYYRLMNTLRGRNQVK